MVSTFAGTGLPVNSFNDFYVNSGTINFYKEEGFNDSYYSKPQWSVSDFSISASDIFSAIRSSNINDDKVIIQKIFSGDDLFCMSDQDDVIDGYAGNDLFETGLGNDVIDGGSGTDTVKLSGNYSSYQITHNALENKFTITGSNETKTVTNVEQFEFNDVSYSSIELKEK